MSTTAISIIESKGMHVVSWDLFFTIRIFYGTLKEVEAREMKRPVLHILALFAVPALFLCIGSCVPSVYLNTVPADPRELEGVYTLILYGGRHSADIENVAILDNEGDQYTFMVYAPEFDYKVKKHVPAKEALAEAEAFVRFHHSFWKAQLKRIVDTSGASIGYEVRPLYSPMDFGYPDVLEVDYLIKGNEVTVRIDLKRELRRRLLDDESPFIFRPSR